MLQPLNIAVNFLPRSNVSTVQISVETELGHPGHIFSGSSWSDPVYNLSGSDPDWIM